MKKLKGGHNGESRSEVGLCSTMEVFGFGCFLLFPKQRKESWKLYSNIPVLYRLSNLDSFHPTNDTFPRMVLTPNRRFEPLPGRCEGEFYSPGLHRPLNLLPT